jgi:hypothetical protein
VSVQIGDRGRAGTPMSPQGKVEIAGDRHDARSDGRFIDAGREIIVVAADHLGLIVREIEPGQEPPFLSNAGQPARVASWHKTGAEVDRQLRREEALQRRKQSIEHRYGSRIGAGLGGLAGILTVCFGFGQAGVEAGSIQYTHILAGVALLGAVLGFGIFWAIHSFLLGAKRDYRNMSLVVLVLSLAGAVGGALFGDAHWGLLGGAIWAFLGALALGALIPGVVFLLEAIGEPEIVEE